MTNKANNPSKKILICDDEEGIRESLKLILGDYYDLIVCDAPEQALECLKNSQDIGLMLLDIKMPRLNGLDVLKSIKEEYPKLPVIMVTGYKSVDTAMEATARGANGYIVKPFKSDEIINTVKRNLNLN